MFNQDIVTFNIDQIISKGVDEVTGKKPIYRGFNKSDLIWPFIPCISSKLNDYIGMYLLIMSVKIVTRLSFACEINEDFLYNA